MSEVIQPGPGHHTGNRHVHTEVGIEDPVDLLFALAVPEDCGEDHLKLLAHIAELFSDSDLLEELRSAESPGQLLQLLSRTPH